jgi:hypothetical protein
VTDVSIVNPYNWRSVEVHIFFLKENQDNSAGAPQYSVSIGRSGQVTIPDIVSRRFGITGKGFLVLSTSDHAYFSTTARTYTGTGGTYGQTELGQKWAAYGGTRALISGVKNGGGFHTNVGGVNASPTAIRLLVTAYDDAGNQKGVHTLQVPAWSMVQIAVSSFASGFSDGYLEVKCLDTTEGIQWVAYATPVDNISHDSTFIEARADTQYTFAQPAYTNLSGWWKGTASTPEGSESGYMYVDQRGAALQMDLYRSWDYTADAWVNETSLWGYLDSNTVHVTSLRSWTVPCTDTQLQAASMHVDSNSISGYVTISSTHYQCVNDTVTYYFQRSSSGPAGISRVASMPFLTSPMDGWRLGRGAPHVKSR